MQLKHYADKVDLFKPWHLYYRQESTLDLIVEKLEVDPALSLYKQQHPVPTTSFEQKEE